MRIDQTSTYTTPTTSSTGTGLGGMSATPDAFLKLFVAQLQNQNPLEPQDNSQMVAQLAQFSSLEQQVESNTRLDDLVASQDSAAGASLTQLAGRTITADASAVTLDAGGSVPPLELTGTPAATGGDLVVRNAEGEVIRRVPITAGPPPTAAWDGKDDHGGTVPAGTYQLGVEATGADGKPVTAALQLRARVDAVELGPDGAHLRLGNLTITPAAVRSIFGPQGDAS
ncbi:MAG TPA: flagellar hook capping FlgD N-terminal domain-containing protein [Kofleriaceae bacterium]|nr:flagellar hook capping FlgD N-terminal domain-containing protein [Kofleriaceae bacterium]